jgi:hypothetical protein
MAISRLDILRGLINSGQIVADDSAALLRSEAWDGGLNLTSTFGSMR